MSGRVVADFGGDFVGGELTRGQKSVIIEPSESGDIDEDMICEGLHQAHNSKAGFCGMLTDLFSLPYNHHQQVTGGVLADEWHEVLQSF